MTLIKKETIRIVGGKKSRVVKPDRRLARRIVRLLNEMLALDPDATYSLIETRVKANAALAAHATIQVSAGDRLGLIGVLNGLCGTIEKGKLKGRGLICAVGNNHTPPIESFALTEERARG